ncbi:kinase-like protein [Anaeromyces robustus]|uniref:dual-specificity kinase n=1 Tax=Anaeromyces robustus TaxID=1754192 RepID=A0A1Y1XC89_9FUNG|nr:kinase-like protein [Anaeromyces robustus]|eukprot:ORX83332.1 kinase-like protein [Anaeromyces robustus]
MNIACDDAVLLQPNEGSSSFIKNEKYYSFNNLSRKSIKNTENEEKNINRVKSLSTSSYNLKPEAIKALSLDKVTEEDTGSTNSLSINTKLKHDKSNEQISIFQMDREDKQPKTAIEPVMANLNPKLCMTPETVLRTKYDILTSYERVEIRDYEEIWYIGSSSVQKIDIAYKKPSEKKHGEKPEVTNNGYDDSRGDYHIVLHDHINYRYEIISLLGKGSFGKVLKCYDHKEKNYVAVKIIKNKKRFEKQGMVEVKVLDAIRSEDPENTMNSYNIKFIESFYFRGHLCIVNELLGINLYEWIKNGGFRGITISMIRHITKEVLTSLEVLENKKIVHCDLKPENILLRDPMQIKPSLSSSDLDKIGIKVIDFGSSCYEHERIYTYVQSRFYRSPEVILGIPYNMSIDMWSLGCILAELYTGYPIFPGENEEEQLACIMEVMGAPAPYIVEKGSRKNNFFEANNTPKIFANSKGKKRRPGSLSLATVLRCRDNTFLDFITQCLQWDPKKRLTASQGLKHEFITKLNKKSSSTDSATKSISTNSMFSTFEEFKNLNNSSNIKKSKSSVGPTPSSSVGLNKSVGPTSSSSVGLNKSRQGSTHSQSSSSKAENKSYSETKEIRSKEVKTYSSIKHSSSQVNPVNVTRSLLKSNSISNSVTTSISSGRKSSGSNLPKMSSSYSNDEHNIQLRKSTSNLISYNETSTNGKVAKIIAAAEQKTLNNGSSKNYVKKDSSLALETIKNVRRPSVKEMAFAKENIERANNLMNSKRSQSQSREGSNSGKKTNSMIDSSSKYNKSKAKNTLSINVSQLSLGPNVSQSKSAYPKLSSGFFGSDNNTTSSSNINTSTTKENIDKSKSRKYSLLSKSFNTPNIESFIKPSATNTIASYPEDNEDDDDIYNLEFNKIDISNNNINNNKSNISSLKQPTVYSLKRSNSSGNMLLGSVQSLRKTFNNSSSNTTSTNNSKYSSSIPTINDDNYDTPLTQYQPSNTINSLSILTSDIPTVKSRPRTYSHSAYQTSQGSSIPRLASIYKNSSNNIAKTINKINNNIESHSNSIMKERDREINNTIKSAGLVTKRKSAFSLKAKMNQGSNQSTTTTTNTNTQPRWRI